MKNLAYLEFYKINYKKHGEEDANGVSTIEKAEAEVDSVEPRYKECDMKTGKITDRKINYDLKGKLIRP